MSRSGSGTRESPADSFQFLFLFRKRSKAGPPARKFRKNERLLLCPRRRRCGRHANDPSSCCVCALVAIRASSSKADALFHRFRIEISVASDGPPPPSACTPMTALPGFHNRVWVPSHLHVTGRWKGGSKEVRSADCKSSLFRIAPSFPASAYG